MWNFRLFSGRFKLLHELCLKYSEMIKLWLGPAILWILVNDPKMIQKVLLSPVCLEKPFFYKFLRLDSGLISAKCKLYSVWNWKKRRDLQFYHFSAQMIFGRFTDDLLITHSTWKFFKLSFQPSLKTLKSLLMIWLWILERRRSSTCWITRQKVLWTWSAVSWWFQEIRVWS